MALRFTVQGDDEQETAAGLELLLTLGLATRMPPRETVGNGWMARAVPRMTTARTHYGPGRSVSG
jgi:hypothetical protein